MVEHTGRLLADAQDIAAYLSLETEIAPAHIRERFGEIAELAREFLSLALDDVKIRYRLPLGWMYDNNKDLWGLNPARVVGRLSPANQERLAAHFGGEAQTKQGAVWLDASHRFTVPGLKSEYINARPVDDAGFLFYLAVASPALQTLLRFMECRHGSPLIRTKEFRVEDPGRDARQPPYIDPRHTQYDNRRANKAWFERTPRVYAELGIMSQRFFDEARSVSHFFNLPVETRHGLVMGFLDQIRADLMRSSVVVECLRASRTQAAIQEYYRLSGKKRKPVPRRRFLKKAHEWLLSGYFAGGWLSFLEYIGEAPAEGDYVSAALPKPRVLIPLQVPGGMGALPPAERERVLDSLDPAGSGLRARLELAQDFWANLIKAHEKQKPGMVSLWGLAEAYSSLPYERPFHEDERGDGVRNPGLFRERLPAALLQRVEELFGRQTAPKYPTGRATALSPYNAFCAHLCPALSFWHGVGLTIWFLTQGPYSRTDIPGMPEYYRKDLHALAEFGCPIDPALFEDLAKIEVVSRGGDKSGITGTLSKAAARSFSRLNKVYVRQLRDWTHRCFDLFWQKRYRQNVTECGRRYIRLRETTGREPTAKKFVTRDVLNVINEYFGGDIYRLLEALGEPLPKDAKVHDRPLIPSVEVLEQALVAFAGQKTLRLDREQLQSHFVDLAIRYCIIWEGRGAPPTRGAFSRFYYYQLICKTLGADPIRDREKAWAKFSETVEQAVKPVLRG